MANIILLSTPEGTVLLKQSIKQTLLDQFLQDWNSSVHNSPKAFNYRIFKTDFKFEEYFNILDEQNSLLLCKFRTTNHKLPIEKKDGVIFRGKIAKLRTLSKESNWRRISLHI